MFEVFKKKSSKPGPHTSKRIISPLKKRHSSVAHPAFKALVALNVLGALIAAWLYYNSRQTPVVTYVPEAIPAVIGKEAPEQTKMIRQVHLPVPAEKEKSSVPPAAVRKDATLATPEAGKKAGTSPAAVQPLRTKPVGYNEPVNDPSHGSNTRSQAIMENNAYTVAGSQVYFHNKPDTRTRRNAFINRWNKAVLKPLDEENGFVYIVYKNHLGQTSKGWMLKKQLKPLD